MGSDAVESVSFEGYRLDRGGLFGRDGELVPLGTRALDLLILLADRAGEVVSKDAIMAAVWPGRAVGDGNLTVQVSALRRVLDRNAARGSLIQTIPGRGYRFVGAVTRSAAIPLGPPEPDKPSIAILPFQNMTGDPEQEYFADGMVEEIITALSRIRWLFVIACNSTFTYKGRAIDVKQVGRELGVRYVLEGSVRKGGSRVRITAQLVEAKTGIHLWADRFNGSLEDVFDLQDQVATSVAGVIEPTLQVAETKRSIERPTVSLTAYDAYLRAFAAMFASARQIPRALELLEEAISHDPGYGPALALAATCCERLCIDGSSRDPSVDRRKGMEYAKRALRVASDDPTTLANAAQPLAFFGEDINAMLALVDRALTLQPSYARGWFISGALYLWAGEPDLVIRRCEAALRLSPRGGIGTVFSVAAHGAFLTRRFNDALPRLLFAIEQEQHPATYRFLAACYAHLGRMEEARATINRLRTRTPVVIPNLDQFRRPEDRELLRSGLRLAMGEEARAGGRGPGESQGC